MGKNLLKIIVSVILLCCTFCLYSQSYTQRHEHLDDPKIFGRNNISVNLIPIFASGLELNYDRKIIDKHWIKLAGTFYRKQDYTVSVPSDIQNLLGYGIKLQHKYHPYFDHRNQYAFFLTYGPFYQNFDLKTKNNNAITMYKYGLDCQIGIRKLFQKVFYFEIYAGLGTSFIKVKDGVNIETILEEHSRLWFDYGHDSHYLSFGINVGVLF